HGVAIEPLADDLDVALAPDRVIVTRPSGLSLSGSQVHSDEPSPDFHPIAIDVQRWELERKADFGKRESQLMMTAADAPEYARLAARVDLARFYLAWRMSAEAKGVLDVALKDNPVTADNPVPLVLRAIASLMLGRGQDALKDLGNPLIGNL